MKLASSRVNIQGLQVQLKPVLQHAAELWMAYLNLELVITCGMDGMHSAGSLHYYGYAVDLRTWTSSGKQLDRAAKEHLAKELRRSLKLYSTYFDVIVHSTHIHVEFDIFKANKVFN